MTLVHVSQARREAGLRAYDGKRVSMEKVADSAGVEGASQGAFLRRGAARWLPWLALPYAIALMSLLSRQADLPGLLHDDGVYVAMARGIEQGFGPVDTHQGADARTARFPPVYPALLAATRVVLGVGTDGVLNSHRWVALNGALLGIAFAAFLHWLLAWRRVHPLLALATTVVAFTLPTLLGVAQHLMSESLFLAELCVALWLHERALVDRTRGRLVAAALITGLLPGTRTIGAAAILALALHRGLAKRRVTEGLRFAAIAVLPWIATASWSAIAAAGATRSPLFGPAYRELLLAHLGDAPWIAWVNVVRFGDWLAYSLAPQWPLADGGSAAGALLRLLPATILLGATIVATVSEWRRGEPPPAHRLVVVATLALLLPWPFPDLRFVLPMAPFAVHALAIGLAAIGARVLPHMAEQVRGASAALPLLALAAWNAPLATLVVRTPRHEEGSAAFFGRSLPVAPFRAVAAELSRRVEADAATAVDRLPNGIRDIAFASTLDSLFSLQCGLRGVSAWVNDQPYEEGYAGLHGSWRRLYYSPVPPPVVVMQMSERADEVLAEYRRLGVRWLLIPRMPGVGMPSHHVLLDRMLQRDRQQAAPRFSPEWRSPGGEFELWRVAP